MFRLLLIAAIFSLGVCASSDERESRIIGGLTAQLRQFPYAASLRRVGTLNHVGGGSLISDQWVLTARSVTDLFTAANQLAVALGFLNFQATIVSPGLVSTAAEIRNHATANLAAVRIPAVACTAARFGVISPIFLESRIQPSDIRGIVAGWGPITADKEPNSVLRFIAVTGVLTFTPPGPPAGTPEPCLDTGTTLCTGNIMCTNDVGGPLVTAAGLIGVASTTNCGGLDTYLRISAFRDWIAANTGV